MAVGRRLLGACEGPLTGIPVPITVFFLRGRATGPGIFPSLTYLMLPKMRKAV